MAIEQREMMTALNDTGVSLITVYPLSKENAQKYELTYTIRNRVTDDIQLKTIQFTHVLTENLIMVELSYKQLELYNVYDINRDDIAMFFLSILKKEVKAQLGGELAYSTENKECDFEVVYNQLTKQTDVGYKILEVMTDFEKMNVSTKDVELFYSGKILTIKPYDTEECKYTVSIGDKLLGIDELDSHYKLKKLVESRF